MPALRRALRTVSRLTPSCLPTVNSDCPLEYSSMALLRRLPQQAGRAFAHLNRNTEMATIHSSGDHTLFRQILGDLAPGEALLSKQGRRIKVIGVARPEPDARLFAKAILEMVKERHKQKESDDESK
jgi:hypothetical protein